MEEGLEKPLGIKAYGSIPHMSGSRMGIGDKRINPGMERMFTEREKDDRGREITITVQEKLDGACVSVAKVNDEILALQRVGFLAKDSSYEQLHLFSDWVKGHEEIFRGLLSEGERVCGEWLAMAHGIRYDLKHSPFVAFDIMKEHQRVSVDELRLKEMTMTRMMNENLGRAGFVDGGPSNP